ncbi:aquaporin [Nocardioides cavernae]|uniref:aquaporin n=1 Tax=Nocardioides TaxID=1839 RepID=UPI0009E861C9|nr:MULTISPECIES: aquaporin [Nocardioides]MCK9823410.1 aquaporin [Nocardioides cavernae]
MSDIVEDTPTTGQKFTAELLGTFVLVFFGCGAFLMSGGDYVATGLTFGLTVVVMAYAVGRISGGHFNPAVTLGAVLGGRLPWNQVGIYMAAQLLGGLLAGAALFGLMHGFEGFTAEGRMGQNSFGDQGSGYAWWAALLLETLLTAVFLWVILAVTDERNEVNVALGPLAIGLALAMIHFASMGATGTSVNPARSIGVGVFAGTDAIVQLWLFVVAPLLGAAVAGLTYPLLFGQGAAAVAGSGLSFGGGRKDQFVPGNYEAQWNQGQQGGWGQPGSAWGAPPQQQWGQPQQPQQQPDPYGAPQGQPQPGQPGQWGQPAPQQPQQQPGQPGQWGAPPAQPQQPGQSAPGHWGNPEGDDDGRTQVRRPD